MRTVRAERLPIADGFEHARTRKQFLAAVAKNLIERLTALPADQWTKVIDAMNTAVTQKHLQVYFNDATAQSGMANFGWADWESDAAACGL